MKPSFLEQVLGQSPKDFAALSPEQRAGAVRRAIPDLNFFFEQGKSFSVRQAPRRSADLAGSLLQALISLERDGAAQTLDHRIITDELLRREADRDQNVYLGSLFTRLLTRAAPDLIFQPVSISECVTALRWGRDRLVPVTLRGAASTAMGGSVPNDGGLTLDLSRLDTIELDAEARVVVIGAGARLRTIHTKLAQHGRALTNYPSNLGGTLVGWFVTGGIGLNAFGRGRALDGVKAADLLLPSGEHLRFHDDGRLDVPDGKHRKTLPAAEAEEWFRARGCPPFGLADLAGSEGTYGLVVQITVKVEARPTFSAFLLSFDDVAQALQAAAWVTGRRGALPPTNLKFFSGSHMHHVRKVWEDEDAREWKDQGSALSSGATLPWKSLLGPADFGVRPRPDSDHAAAYLYVDFTDRVAALSFAEAVDGCPGSPRVLGEESLWFAAERFKPQQTKRLGPGMLAAEIVMPSGQVPAFLPRAEALARAAGNDLDTEVYYLADGSALMIAGYLTDHRSGEFGVALLLAPALLDLAIKHYGGKPYVLGRWQAAYFRARYGNDGKRLVAIRRALDPTEMVSRGIRYRLRLRGVLGWLVGATMVPGVALLTSLLAGNGGASIGNALRSVMRLFPGPARGRGEPAAIGATFHTTPPDAAPAAPDNTPARARSKDAPQSAAARALNCVNCGECNTVCPIFHEAGIRLPQMLTHLGEAAYAGQDLTPTGGTLLDLCMRCGNCEEVCQAGIPHLPLYEVMQAAANRQGHADRERHLAILGAVRGSTRYTREFLDLRPGGYIKRTPASLPGVARFRLLRAENDAGPAATCIHCGGCVPVCPTAANKEFEGSDPRWITTDQERCIGCGTCVEVCPANLLNGGQTLRVMEAPADAWFEAVAEFERRGPST